MDEHKAPRELRRRLPILHNVQKLSIFVTFCTTVQKVDYLWDLCYTSLVRRYTL